MFLFAPGDDLPKGECLLMNLNIAPFIASDSTSYTTPANRDMKDLPDAITKLNKIVKKYKDKENRQTSERDLVIVILGHGQPGTGNISFQDLNGDTIEITPERFKTEVLDNLEKNNCPRCPLRPVLW